MRRFAYVLMTAFVMVAMGCAYAAPGGASSTTSAPKPAQTLPPADPSGQAMPVGDVPGWHQIFADNFANETVPVGSFPSAVSSKWDAYNATGDPLPAWQDTSKNGHYDSLKTTSIANGVMDMWLHTENGIHYSAGPEPKLPVPPAIDPLHQTYGRYAVRWKADVTPGYKTAWLLWNDAASQCQGETDFPEANLDGSDHVTGFLHYADANDCTSQFQGSSGTVEAGSGWHTTVVEWSPNLVKFFLDGTQVGTNYTTHVMSGPERLVLQTETQLSGGAPAANVSGHVQVDWLTAYSYDPSVTGPQPVAFTQPDTSQPIRAAFYYPWFGGAGGQGWNQQGFNPFTNYNPIYGNYDITQAQVEQHIQDMVYGNIHVGIGSWWGQGSFTDTKFPALFAAAEHLNSTKGTNFLWAPYYETEGNGANPTPTQIVSDLNYLKTTYGSSPAFLKVNGKPVIFVYGEAGDACSSSTDYAQRWHDANTQLGNSWYIVLKVFNGYQTCAAQPDSWHQYGPASSIDTQGNFSVSISPGFWKKGDTGASPVGSPRLARDVGQWANTVQAMDASPAQWHLITTFNEWGEGTAIEPAQEFASDSGHGAYLDVLHRFPEGGTAVTTTTTGSNVHTAPNAPTNVVGAKLDINHATVSWKAPTNTGGDPITSYTVVSSPGSHTAVVSGSPPATTATVAQLSPTAPSPGYTFTVTATNTNGTSPASTPSNPVNTGATGAVPTAPTSPTVTAVGNAQATVSWVCSADISGAPVLDYTVYPSSGTATAVAAPPCNATTNKLQTDITGLTNGTAYTFTVKARNANGYSTASSVTSPAVTPAGSATVPGPPTGVVASAGNAQATVSWTAPANGGSAITSYIVTPFAGATALAPTTVTGAPPTTSQTVTGLTNGTAYSFKVKATNAIGTGADSGASVAVTPSAGTTVPGVPTSVTATIPSGTNNTVTVNWATPASTGGSAITGYTVKQDDGTLTQLGVVNSTTLTGVTAGAHTYQVAAKNVVGASAYSNTSNSVTVTSPPSGGGGLAVSSTTPCNAAHNPTPPRGYKNIIVIMEENHQWPGFPGGGGFPLIPRTFGSGMPNWASWYPSCATFDGMLDTARAPTSLEQYMGFTTGHHPAGSAVDDCSPGANGGCNYTGDNIYREVDKAGLTVQNYVEGSNGSCTSGSSAPRHTPSLAMWGTADDAGNGGSASHTRCVNETKTLIQSGQDLLLNNAKNGTLPNFSMVTPTDDNDAHQGCLSCADSFFAKYAKPIFDGPQYQRGEVLVIMMFDEDRYIPNMFMSPYVKGGPFTLTGMGQYSLLQDISRWLTAGTGANVGVVATDGLNPTPTLKGFAANISQ